MENERRFMKAGRFLTAEDISRLDSLVFMPAVDRCDREGLCDTDEGAYYKNTVEPVKIIDGVEYYSRFYSEMDKTTGACTHYVMQDAVMDCQYSLLSDEERGRIRMQFQTQYLAEGGAIELITDDESWVALNDEKQYDDITVEYMTVTRYIFSDTTAVRDTYIHQAIEVPDEGRTVIGQHDLEGSNFSDSPVASLASDTHEYSPEEVAELDMLYADMCTVTTSDLKDVCEIMTSLGLITWKDQKRLVSGGNL